MAVVLQVSFLLYLVNYKRLQPDWYAYPAWVSGLGWFLMLSPVLSVPVWIVGHMSLTAGTFRQVGIDLYGIEQPVYQ